jgi:undecaprenyl diphosphate synthase
MTKLNHIVIVPDGNRRWARQHGRPASFGHYEGAKAAEKILGAALDLKVPCLTLWGCSVANVTERSPAEVKVLFAIFGRYFKKLLTSKEIHENRVRVDFLGRWPELFPASVQKVIRSVIKATEHYDRHRLTFLLAYDGRDEMATAIEAITAQKRKNPKLTVTRDLIKRNLWTHDLPPVDLVIRTGGEPHWSAGLMMWDVAEARLHFTPTFWPAFTPAEFKRIITAYDTTERRFGR